VKRFLIVAGVVLAVVCLYVIWRTGQDIAHP
jgi:hypothetical protein